MGSKKGPPWERLVATKLSQWWTGGERDDVFWRTQGSGARATTRGKLNKQTHNQYGDITSTDPAGDDLMRVLTLECKRGYSKDTIYDLMDAPSHAAEQEYTSWFKKILRDSEKSNSLYWMLITKRDKRNPVVFVPWELVEALEEIGSDKLRTRGLYASFHVTLEYEDDFKIKLWVSCFPLSRWFRCVTPNDIREILEENS